MNKKKKWFDNKLNTFIYVDGLPLDTNSEEIKEYFNKCGAIKLDKYTGEECIKIYKDKETGLMKGDARIGFMQPESVEIAIQMLDNSYFRPDY